ncbi:molybdenum cofactor biosynthesis protein MoaE [Actinospica durhamensis]|uniref:Molybdenum cofactor biosynthesis protein MoaE n=1 Tax=Actinospica durhamensis TaxID=1508375 RepID=A0A941EQT4_9ACTN|nr:molybdenum cofactor biosynthesis protein MoaE [Actinospica durhamensis]MBR7833424.1 molybdenum cofactor biosynthesis protein MoaE [Actinospica durhamensis]
MTSRAGSVRTGPLAIGDAAIITSVATALRQAAFETCARVVEVIEAREPIWKHRHFADGASESVNCAH